MLNRVSQPKGPGYLPADYMDRQRTFPYGGIKADVYLKAVRDASVIHSSAGRSDYSWEFAGPSNIGGRITDIEIPGESFSTIYIAAASGGILKTTNNGASWTNIFKDQATIPVGDIAISQNNPDLMYAGTGEANSSSQSFRGDGIYKSVDGGTTWQHTGLDLSAYIGRIVIDYSNSERVFAAACGNLFTPDGNRGIYRTTNGGNTWERVLFISDSTSAIDLVQHPTNPDILYATMWERIRGLNYRRSFGETSGIWKTTDGGDTWTELTSGLPQGSETGRIGIAISPSSPSVLYAFYDNESEVAVFKTQNSGQNWTRTNDNALQGMNSSFGWYFGQVRIHPDSPDRIYVLGVYLYYSSNGGNSWSEMGYEMHVDHHALLIHPVTGRMYEGNDGGLYFSDDDGAGWYKINNLPLTQFYDIEIDYLNPGRLYGGTQDNNTVRTWTGQINDWEAILGGDGFYSLVDYTNSSIIYAEYQWGALHKSTNGGNWMEPINGYWSSDRVNWSAPVIMHSQEPQTLYFGTYRVWKTTNGGNTWNAISNDLTQGDDGSTYHTISTLAISAIEPGIVLAGTDDGRVHISTNGGSVWNDISAGLPDRWITRVATDPFDVNTIYVTLSGFRWDEPLAHVYKSTNLGQTWQPISNGLPELPVNALIADPGEQGRLFIGTDAGVFMSEDSGDNWQSMNQGIGNVPVTSMKIHKDENFLIIGTYGLSAFRFDLNQLNVGVEDNQEPLKTLSIPGIFPNPFSIANKANLHITVGSSAAGFADVSIVDLMGRDVRSHNSVSLKQGLNTILWDGNSNTGRRVKAGTYLIRVKSGNREVLGKVLVIN
ncbi:MAG: T9SS type A sorting domain-containing protein [Bacteroidota bacterium]